MESQAKYAANTIVIIIAVGTARFIIPNQMHEYACPTVQQIIRRQPCGNVIAVITLPFGVDLIGIACLVIAPCDISRKFQPVAESEIGNTGRKVVNLTGLTDVLI